MLHKTDIFMEDLRWIAEAELPWEKLQGCSILVTGATGLIGMTAVHALLCAGSLMSTMWSSSIYQEIRRRYM